jgi:hypothetical protein
LKKCIVILGTVVPLLLTGCVTASGTDSAGNSITVTLTSDHASNPIYDLHNDYGPDPALENGGNANSCIISTTLSGGRDGKDICRVIDGFPGTPTAGQHWHIYGTPTSVHDPNTIYSIAQGVRWGLVVGYDVGGQPLVFEGCTMNSSTDYICEYHDRKDVIRGIINPSGGYDYLKQIWNYEVYLGNAGACAGGVAAYIAGQGSISLPFLTSCAAGPEQPS